MTAIINNEYYQQLETLDPMERGLYEILKTFKDNTTHQCYPSVPTLAKKLKRCVDTTRKYLYKLRNKGFISIQAQKVTHKVTNNKYNEPNLYTLLLEESNKIIPVQNTEVKEVIELKETKLQTIISELSSSYDSDIVVSALRTMRKNIKNGSIIYNMKNYLESLIGKASNQLLEVDKALENSKALNSTSPSSKATNKRNYSSNKINTKFHNFQQRSSLYTPEQLKKMVMGNHKNK